jgi:predicted metalloprotease with PDZ domain
MKTFMNTRVAGAFLAGFLLVIALAGTTWAASKVSEETAWLGVQLQALTDDLKEAMDMDADAQGVLVAAVVDGSPADKAGLEDGDVILSLDGQNMTSVKQMVDAIRAAAPGDVVTIEVLRDGRHRTMDVELGKADKDMRVRDVYIPDVSQLEGLTNKAHKWVQAWDQERGYLGVGILDVNADLGEYFKVKEGEGVLITSVAEDSPAEEAGLKAGDVVLEYDGKDVKKAGEFRDYVASTEPGKEVSMVVKRKGRNKTLDVEIGEMDTPMSSFLQGFMQPQGMPRGRMIIRGDDGDIKVYGKPGESPPRCCIPGNRDSEWSGRGVGPIFIGDIDDLEGIEGLEGLQGLKGTVELKELQQEIDNLHKEMQKLHEEIEKLKQ